MATFTSAPVSRRKVCVLLFSILLWSDLRCILTTPGGGALHMSLSIQTQSWGDFKPTTSLPWGTRVRMQVPEAECSPSPVLQPVPMVMAQAPPPFWDHH